MRRPSDVERALIPDKRLDELMGWYGDRNTTQLNKEILTLLRELRSRRATAVAVTAPLREFWILPRYGIAFTSAQAADKASVINVDPFTTTEIVHVREVSKDE